MSRIYQARFLLNGQERAEKIPAATPYDAIKSIQAKYPTARVFVYRVVIVSAEAEIGGASMTQPPASVRDALLEMLAAVGAPPYRSARLLRAVEQANRVLRLRGLCENCDDPTLIEFRHDVQLYLCGSCYAFQLHEIGVSSAS